MERIKIIRILEKIISKFSGKCPYWERCPYYQSDGAVCNGKNLDLEKGFSYCGKYREYEK